MFARMNWNGDRYENRVTDEAEMRNDLRAWGEPGNRRYHAGTRALAAPPYVARRGRG